MDEKVKNREIEKIYLAAVVGTPRPAAGRLEGYLFKDAKNNQVYVYDAPRTGAKTAVTEYKTIASDGRLTLVECRLITGRTHQIRAQFRHAGCPLLGDGKYGRERTTAPTAKKGQALCSWRLRFVFDTPRRGARISQRKELPDQNAGVRGKVLPGVRGTHENVKNCRKRCSFSAVLHHRRAKII